EPKDEFVLWDIATATAKPLGHGYPTAMFTPDSKQFALCLVNFGEGGGTVKLLDANGTELAELAASKNETFAWPKLSPDGKRRAVQMSKDRLNLPATLRVWDLPTRKELVALSSGGDFAFEEYTFSPDGKRLAATDYNGGVRVWDIATGRAVVTKAFG